MGRTRRGGRWGRIMFVALVAVAVGALVGGLLVAFQGYRETSGPAGAVRGYFAALRRGDAPAALGFGTLPAGPHTLLTSKVLHEQRSLGPIEDVKVRRTDRSGDRATVSVDYTIAFPDKPDRISDRVEVRKQGSSWRLTETAVLTRLDVVGAAQRATIAGAPLPSGDVLVFPGAAPIRLDTPYLAIDSPTAEITFAAQPTTSLSAVVSARGERETKALALAALRACLAPNSDPRCPLPDARAVPATLRGALPANAADELTLSLGSDTVGRIEVRGDLPITGSYTVLDFDNVASVKRGPVTWTVRGTVVAVAPLTFSWWRSDSG